MSYRYVISAVVIVLGACSPLAVVRAISEVIILALKRVGIVRPWPHIAVELFKRIPARVNSKTSTAMPFVSIRVGVVASGSHRKPNSVFFGVSNSASWHNILHKISFHMKGVYQQAWKPAFGATLGTGVIIPWL